MENETPILEETAEEPSARSYRATDSTHNRIRALAGAFGRTLEEQIAVMAKVEYETVFKSSALPVISETGRVLDNG